MNFAANQVIFKAGDKAQRHFICCALARWPCKFTGRAEVRKPCTPWAKVMFWAPYGRDRNRSGFLTPRPCRVTRAIALEFACLKKHCDQHPDLGYELLQRFVGAQAKMLKTLETATGGFLWLLKRRQRATRLSASQHPMVPRPFRVVRYRRELRDTFTLIPGAGGRRRRISFPTRPI